MKKLIFILFSLMLVSIAFAQEDMNAAEETSTTKAEAPENGFGDHHDTYIVGLSYIQWNEKMNLQSGGLVDEDKANFVGTTVNIEKNLSYHDWGWAYGGNLGSGKATGGGNSTKIPFQKGNQAWTSIGAYAKVYKKFSGRMSMGLVAPLVYRQIKWPNDPNGFPVDSGKDINTGLLFELNFRISKSFDFYQDIGPFSSAEGATLWRIGLGYRL